MTDVNLQPEQEARVLIDQMLRDAGWVVQKTGEVDLTASRGVAVREFQTANGPVDYLLYIDRKSIGTIEAKKAGETLRSVEWQSAKRENAPSWRATRDQLPAEARRRSETLSAAAELREGRRGSPRRLP